MFGFLKSKEKEVEVEKPVEIVWVLARCNNCSKLICTEMTKSRAKEVCRHNLILGAKTHNCIGLREGENLYATPIAICHNKPTNYDIIQ